MANLDDPDIKEKVKEIDKKHKNILDDRILQRKSTLVRGFIQRRQTIQDLGLDAISTYVEEPAIKFADIVKPDINNPADFSLTLTEESDD